MSTAGVIFLESKIASTSKESYKGVIVNVCVVAIKPLAIFSSNARSNP